MIRRNHFSLVFFFLFTPCFFPPFIPPSAFSIFLFCRVITKGGIRQYRRPPRLLIGESRREKYEGNERGRERERQRESDQSVPLKKNSLTRKPCGGFRSRFLSQKKKKKNLTFLSKLFNLLSCVRAFAIRAKIFQPTRFFLSFFFAFPPSSLPDFRDLPEIQSSPHNSRHFSPDSR